MPSDLDKKGSGYLWTDVCCLLTVKITLKIRVHSKKTDVLRVRTTN